MPLHRPVHSPIRSPTRSPLAVKWDFGGDTAEGALLDFLQPEPSGVVINGRTGMILIRDAAKPANNYYGGVNNKLTYTAPSTKWIRTAAGLLESGTTIRVNHDTSNLAFGFMSGPARTNIALYSDDFTQVDWVKVNMTAGMTATGAEGAANSATTLTATAGNATVLQIIVSGSAARISSCYIKRRTGSGVVEMTQDNGITWTPVTVTAGWTRVEIPSATLANPIVGLRIVTSGDAVDAQFFQQELGAYISSPIRTTTVSVTRDADQIILADGTFPSMLTAATIITRIACASTVVSTTAGHGLVGTTGANDRINVNTTTLVVTSGGALQYSATIGARLTTKKTRVLSAIAGTQVGAYDGAAASAGTGSLMPANLTNGFQFRTSNNVTNAMDGHTDLVILIPRLLTQAQATARSAY